MNSGDNFLATVREITMNHLNMVARETGELFIGSLPERVDGNAVYSFLQENYEMNEVQQLCACFVRLFNRDYENGQFFFTELEFEGMQRLLVMLRGKLPDEDVKYIGDLVRILEKGSADSDIMN